MIPTKFFKFLTLFLLLALTAGYIEHVATDVNPVTNLNSSELTVSIQNLISSKIENPLTEETNLIEQNKTEGNENASYSTYSISLEAPKVPTYSEEKTNIVYPKEYRRYSLNFKRGIGSRNERIESEVFNITGKKSGYNIKDACDVFDYVNRHWEYRYEENADFLFDASQTIDDGYKGDCDDYSIVMSALLKNMGFNTRIVTVTNETSGHAYPELYIGNNEETAYGILRYVQARYTYAENIWYSSRELEDGKLQYWLNFDWSGSNGYRHPGGIYVEGNQVIYYPTGLIEF